MLSPVFFVFFIIINPLVLPNSVSNVSISESKMIKTTASWCWIIIMWPSTIWKQTHRIEWHWNSIIYRKSHGPESVRASKWCQATITKCPFVRGYTNYKIKCNHWTDKPSIQKNIKTYVRTKLTFKSLLCFLLINWNIK